MKKAFLIAFAALCAFTAQAVTFTWNSADGAFTGFKENGQLVQVTGAATISVTFTMPNVSSMSGDIVSLVTQSGEKLGVTDWAGTQVKYTGGTTTVQSGGHFSNARLYNSGTGENTMTITLPALTNGYGQIAWSFDGANGQTNYNNNEKYTRTWLTGDLIFDDLALGDGVVVSSITLTTDSYTTVPTVPEPTALALLALGVAGLALKRKVA